MTWILTILLIHLNSAPELWVIEIPTKEACQALGNEWLAQEKRDGLIAYFHCDKRT